MQCSQVLLLLVVVVVGLVHQSEGHYYRRSYYNKGLSGRTYAGSRYRGYHGGYRRRGGYSTMRTVFRSLYNHYRNKNNDYDLNTIDDDNNDPYNDNTRRVIIRLPTSVVRNPNFKMSDLPFYLSSGLFDPDNFPGPLSGGAASILGAPPNILPTPIVDPTNPTGFTDDTDDLENDLNQILGGGANTNLLGGTQTNLLGGANTNLLGGVKPNLLGGANTNILGVPNNNVLGVPNNVLGGANGNLLGGGNTGFLPQGGDPNTDFYNTKTGGIL